MLVAFVPGRVHQLLEGGECLMDRIARELRIGDVPLNTHDAQFGTEGTTATDSNNIAQHLAARWFADDAPIHALFARQEAIHDCAGPVKSGAFFVGRRTITSVISETGASHALFARMLAICVHSDGL